MKKKQLEIFKQSNPELETCVRCGKTVNIQIAMHVDERKTYVEGVGQLCLDCYNNIYP